MSLNRKSHFHFVAFSVSVFQDDYVKAIVSYIFSFWPKVLWLQYSGPFHNEIPRPTQVTRVEELLASKTPTCKFNLVIIRHDSKLHM